LRDSADLEREERAIVGRLRESDPAWLPRVGGPPRPVDPRSDDVVMHLLKESLPERQNGYTMRSRYTLLAQRAVGLEPFVVTSLGFPRSVGTVPEAAVETVDGIAHHRLDLGPAWPGDVPVDVVLTDTAWLAARIARRERPAIIHAGSGFRGYDAALVGLALREHLDLLPDERFHEYFSTCLDHRKNLPAPPILHSVPSTCNRKSCSYLTTAPVSAEVTWRT
jgi:hypothetical protein